jgi:hypothetical protein
MSPTRSISARESARPYQTHFMMVRRVRADRERQSMAVLTSQCLDRRIPNKQILIDEIAAWEHDRNASDSKAD